MSDQVEAKQPHPRIHLRREPGALEAFERRTAWPMMAVVLASLVALLTLCSPTFLRPLTWH